jgi:hypothetical protein
MNTHSNSKFKAILVVLAFLISSASMVAQHFVGFYANYTTPLKQFNDSGYRNGVGFSVEYLSPSIFGNATGPFETRVSAGFEFSHHGSSKKVKDLVFNTPNNDKGSVKIQNLIFGFYVAPRFLFNIGDFSPYVDVIANYRIFNTYQVNRFNNEVPGYERESSTPVIQNGVAHYGGSLGFMYYISKSVCLDARVTYTQGKAVQFANLNSLEKDPNIENSTTYKKVYSPVSDALTFRLGALFTLSPNEDRRSYKSSSISPGKKPAQLKPSKPINY